MSFWAEGLIPPLLDRILPSCDARAVAHFRATCKAWRRDCSRHLTKLEVTPLPLDEFRRLADVFPNIQSLTISRGRADVRGCWIQTEHIQALTSFQALSTVSLESLNHLRNEELRQLQRLDKLRSLSLPSVRLNAKQQKLLLNSPSLTSLILDMRECGYVYPIDSATCGGLRFVQLPTITACAYGDISGNVFTSNISSLSSIQSLSVTLCVNGDHKVVERLLLCPKNIRRVVLDSPYHEWTPAFLEGVGQSPVVVELHLHTPYKQQEYVEYSPPQSWMNTLISITCLKLSSMGPDLLASTVCMDWLLVLKVERLRSAPVQGFGCISQLTSLTSLRVSSEHVDKTGWTCLYPLKALASCRLEAFSHYTGDFGCPVVMHHGSDVLFCMNSLTQLQVHAVFPVSRSTSQHSLMDVSSNLCCLVFDGLEQVSEYCLDVIARMTCLTRLSLAGKSFPIGLSSISTLRWLKELRLLSSGVSAADLAFVCDFQFLARLQLRSLGGTDDMFVHAAQLDKLTTLDITDSPQLTDAIFLHLKYLDRLRELRIRGCVGVSRYCDVPPVLTCLHRLRTVSINIESKLDFKH